MEHDIFLTKVVWRIDPESPELDRVAYLEHRDVEDIQQEIERAGIDISKPFTVRIDTVRQVWLVSQ